MSAKTNLRQANYRSNSQTSETFNIDDALAALRAGDIAVPAASGPRARKRARNKAAKKSGYLLPLLAAQGCLAVGKDELPLGSSGAGSREGGAAGAGLVEPQGPSGSGGGSNSSSSGPISTMPDSFETMEEMTLRLEPADVLSNDTAVDSAGLEIVRVFGAINGTVMFDGAIIEFMPAEGFEGQASFQYEVRDSNGNLSTAVVEVAVNGTDGAHGDMHGDAEGGHVHADDPNKASEHQALLNLVPVADATHVAVTNGSWFDPSTWANGEIPGEGAQVLIPDGVVVNYDGQSDASLLTVRVDGMLQFATDQNTFMEVDTFVVSPTGHLTIGTIDQPVNAGVEAVIQIADNGPIDVAWDPMLLSRGLISHGTIDVHGAEKDSFLRLAEDPMRGDTSLVLEEVPSGWNVGDRLVLTGTNMGTREVVDTGETREITTEDEELIITRIEGNVVHFADALQYNHDAPRDDLKAYVANYTRNVRVITENADDLPPSQRGHVMLMHSDNIDVRYGEFTDLGRTDKSTRAFDLDDLDVVASDSNLKGRYSLHIHRAGVSDIDDPAMLVGNAVWGSPGWGYVHHDSNAVFANNAAYDVFGAAFVAESGNEIGRWVGNISIKNEGVGGQDAHLNTAKTAEDVWAFDLGRNGTGFWFQSRLIDAVDNVAAGSPGGQGFTYFHRGSDGNGIDDSLVNLPEQFRYHHSEPFYNAPPISQFADNEAIAVGVGFMVVKAAPEQGSDLRSVIEDFTAWNVRAGAHLQYTAHYTFTNPDFIGTPGTGWTEVISGFDISQSVHELTIIGGTVDGFFLGAQLNKHFEGGENPNVMFIGTEFKNFVSDHRGDGTMFWGATDWDHYYTFEEAAALDGAGELSFDADLEQFGQMDQSIRGYANLTGTKTDSLGEYNIGEWDQELFGTSAIRNAAIEEGYWSLPDGRIVTAFERYFTDRATGEVIKVSQFVQINQPEHEIQKAGGEYRGLLDLNGSGPDAVDDFVTIGAGERTVIDVVANDTDPDGDPVSLDGVLGARHGSVWVNDDGTVTYQADPNFTGTDEFYYWAEDDNGNLAKAMVQVVVEA